MYPPLPSNRPHQRLSRIRYRVGTLLAIMTFVGIGTFIDVRIGFTAAIVAEGGGLPWAAAWTGLMCASIMLLALIARRLPPMVLFLSVLYVGGSSVLALICILKSFRGWHAVSRLVEVPDNTYSSDYTILAAMGAVICINIGLILAWMLASANRDVE